MTKRQKLENRYYKLLKAGKFQEAKRVMDKMIQMDVQNLENR